MPPPPPLRRRADDDAPRFLNWLTHDRRLRAEDVTFDSFAALWKEIDVSGRPTRVQSTGCNCVLYAMWTAVEVLLGELPCEPPWMRTELRVPKGGMPMHALQSNTALHHFLAKSGLKSANSWAEPTRGTSLVALRAALSRGVVVAGLRISMFDDDETHVRSSSVKREFLDRRRRPSGKWGNCMICHSVCFVGYCEVAGHGYVITKDTQDPDDFGHRGCALLPIEEALGPEVEMYTLARRE